MPPDDPVHCLRPKELAARWRCRVAVVKAMVAGGQLAAFKIGGRVRVPFEAVIDAERGVLAMKPIRRKRREAVPDEVARLLET